MLTWKQIQSGILRVLISCIAEIEGSKIKNDNQCIICSLKYEVTRECYFIDNIVFSEKVINRVKSIEESDNLSSDVSGPCVFMSEDALVS